MARTRRVDVAILGAGTAGLAARAEVAERTDRYAVVDPGPLGTTCARVACMPSKALIRVADAYREIGRSPCGITARELGVDTAAVMRHVRRLRDSFVDGVLEDMQSWRGDHLINKRARFIDAETLDLEGERLRADNVIVATGSRPAMPKPWQPFAEHLLDTDRIFELERLPPSLAVIGLGSAGIELAQALRTLGVWVVGFDQHRAIGGLSDPAVQDYALAHFRESMDLRIADVKLERGADGRPVVKQGDDVLDVERVLVATGRNESVRDLGLAALGVELDERGLPAIDEATLKAEGLPIFFAGDVNGRRPVLHEAADEGRIAAHNATHAGPEPLARRTPLSITFTSPTIAVVGASRASLEESDSRFVVGEASFERQGRARIMDQAVGLVRLYARPDRGRLLGAELFAPRGEHLAHLIAWAITAEQSVADLMRMPYYHPVLEEGLRTAVKDAVEQISEVGAHTERMRCNDAPVA